MTELTNLELEEINGGIVPLIGYGAAVAGHFMARSFAGFVVSRVGMITGGYGLAEYVGTYRSE